MENKLCDARSDLGEAGAAGYVHGQNSHGRTALTPASACMLLMVVVAWTFMQARYGGTAKFRPGPSQNRVGFKAAPGSAIDVR